MPHFLSLPRPARDSVTTSGAPSPSRAPLRALAASLATLIVLPLAALGSVPTPVPTPRPTRGPSPSQSPLPGLRPHPAWSERLQQARGRTLRFAMWSGDIATNTWVDTWVAPRLQQRFGISLQRVPLTDTAEAVNKLLAEKAATRKTGTLDLLWINGENFQSLKTHALLWGPFTSQLPHFSRYYDTLSPDLCFDFGTPVEGLEAPYGRARFVFIYNSDTIKNPPRSFTELVAWIRSHPGRFTYPAPPDFTGSAFLRQTLYELSGGPAAFFKNPGPPEKTLSSDRLAPYWKFLTEIETSLWRRGKTYPESIAQLHQLFADGEVDFSMSYSPLAAQSRIEKGTFPPSVRTFVFNSGTLANTHFLAIPYNAPESAAALVAIDFLLSPEAQLSKLQPFNWGDLTALDLGRLSPQQKSEFEKTDLGSATLPLATLAKKALPELPPDSINWIEKEWKTRIAP